MYIHYRVFFYILTPKSTYVTCSICYRNSQSLVLFWKALNNELFAMVEYFIVFVVIENHNTVPGAMIDAVWKGSIVWKVK